MTLEMHIDNILVDRIEVDFSTFETLRQRERRAHDLCANLYMEHFEKIYSAPKEVSFYLVAPSRANEIIKKEI